MNIDPNDIPDDIVSHIVDLNRKVLALLANEPSFILYPVLGETIGKTVLAMSALTGTAPALCGEEMLRYLAQAINTVVESYAQQARDDRTELN